MSETQESDWLPFKFGKGKKRRDDVARTNAMDRLEGSRQPYSSGPSDRMEEAKNTDVPTNTEYAMEATKKALAVLKGIADIVKFPLVKEIIELGISILDTCQTISDVQSGVQRLRDRITCLLLSVADSTKEAEESDRLVKDLQNLKECLGGIMRRLKSIADQNTFKSSFLSAPNMKIISDCEKDFQDSVQRFQVLRSLEMGQNITLIQQQLAQFYGISLDMADKLENIGTDVSDIKSLLMGMKASQTINTKLHIPQLTSPLFGRKEIVQRIVDQLSNPAGSRICILGPGGMGKTSTALEVINHSRIKETFGEDRYWVPCLQANSINNFIAILFKHVNAEKRTGDPVEDIIATLRETDKRRIILLDNFETPWRGIRNAVDSIKPILAKLDSIPHISILLTMRSEWAPVESWRCEHLKPIELEDSQDLYTSIDPDALKYPNQLKELLDALGHMPYAVKLMASRGKRSGANPEKLLAEWQREGTDMLSRREEGINRCIELSVESSYVRGSKDAMRILQILSMLPAGVNQGDLSIWAGEWSSEAIETLRDTALIITRSVSTGENSTMNHHLVLPVVQSYMSQKDRIPLEIRTGVLKACYRFLAANNATVDGPNNPLFKKHLAAIASQEANLQALLTDALDDQHPQRATSLSASNYLDALLVYISYQEWARPRTEIAEQVVSLAQKVAAPHQEAAAYFCLGNILSRMDKFNDALQALERAHAVFERVGNDIMALRSQLKYIELDAARGTPNNELQIALDAVQSRWGTTSSVKRAFRIIRSRWKTLYPIFDAYMSYHHGNIKLYENEARAAIPLLEEAAKEFNRLELNYDQAESLYLISRVYAVHQDFSTALQNIDSSIKLYIRIFGEGFKTPDIVNALGVRTRCLKGMERWDDEMEATLSAALEASRELGLSGTTLMLLEDLGEVFVRKGDLAAAREAYQEAIRKGHGLDDRTSIFSVQKVEKNLKHIDYLCAKSQGSAGADFVPFSPPDRH